MIEISRLGLTKLILWSEAERFQTYPQAMARLISGNTYTRDQVTEELMQLAQKNGKHYALRGSQTRNLFGFDQVSKDKLVIQGINLLQQVTPFQAGSPGKYGQEETVWSPTEAALRIGKAYRDAPSGITWQQLLAEQLLRYEPRTRVLLHLLSHGHTLHFETLGYFSGVTQGAVLVGKSSYALFQNQGSAFNDLLFEHCEVAVGPWWRVEFESAGFELISGFSLEGARFAVPSSDKINSALKAALFVFYSLGILVEDNGAWYVDTDTFSHNLSRELSQELLGEAYEALQVFATEWDQLAYLVDDLADERGFVIVSKLAERWGELEALPPGEQSDALDSLIRHGIFEERVEIIDRHLGQPRMGRGLFDDDNMRMVKLRVLR